MTENINSSKTRAVILERAKELFLSVGYHNTTMRAIAQKAGISTSPLYFHFRNKAEVFFYICNDAFELLIKNIQTAVKNADHSSLRLRDIFYAYKDFYCLDPQLFEIMHLVISPQGEVNLPQPLVITLQKKYQEIIVLMEDIIKEEIERKVLRPVDPRKLAFYLCSVAEGIFLLSRAGALQKADLGLDEMIEVSISLIGVGMFQIDPSSLINTNSSNT